MLRAAGIKVVLHDDVFPTAERGLVGVSHDSKIRYTSASRDDILRYGARLLILKGKTSHDGLARNFVLTYHAIERFLQRHEAPFIAKVYRHPHDATKAGRVEMWLSGATP